MPALPRRPLFVIGMHHSGTEMVARALYGAGALPGEANGRSNPAAIINEALLNDAGGNWWQPPSRMALKDSLANALPDLTADSLIKDLTGRSGARAQWIPTRPWLLEDPRFCLTLPWWFSRFPQARLVWVQRDPETILEKLLAPPNAEGAASAAFRPEEAMELIERYDTAALRAVKTAGATVLSVHYEALSSPDQAERNRAWHELSAFAGVKPGHAPISAPQPEPGCSPSTAVASGELASPPVGMQGSPLVSVIVPNYNHAPYLDERIGSIVNQTYKNIEILLMDDLSPDDSRAVLKAWESKDDRISLLFNTRNSGSPFHQWNLGAQWAKGKYLWIAESDDIAELDMLETHVGALENNEDAVIAYSQSAIIDENGGRVSNWNRNYDQLFGSSLHWRRRFTKSGATEVAERMVFSNTIPNASGALIRKSAFDRAGLPETSWRLNGDWLFYSRLLQFGDVVFFPGERNKFRQHRETQRNRGNKNSKGFFEVLSLMQIYEAEEWTDDETLLAARRQVAGWWMNSIFHMMPNKRNLLDNARLYREFSRFDPGIRARLVKIFIRKCGRWINAKLGRQRDPA